MKGKVAGAVRDVMYQPPSKVRPPLALPQPYTPLVYHNGPIIPSPELVSFYWGPFTIAEINTMQAWLEGFAGFLSGLGASSRQEPVVRQYGIVGASVGAFYLDPAAPTTTVGWPEIGDKIQDLQKAGKLPAFNSKRIFLTLTKGVTIGGYGTIWLGVHGGDAKGPIAICPFPAGPDPMPGWQAVVCHEVMEAATDPQESSGWVADNHEEGGDLCQWMVETAPFGAVEGFADNRHRKCSIWTSQMVWGPGESLGGSLASAPVSVTRSDARMDIFARATDDSVWHTWWDRGLGWGSGESLGGAIASAPFVVMRGNDSMEVFARARDNTLWHRSWDHGSGWGADEHLAANIAAAPFVITRGAGRMDVFARAADNTVWHTWWDHGIGWGAGESLGGQIASAPFVVTRGNDRIDVFAQAMDNTLWHTWWDQSTGWGAGESLGGHIISAPVAALRGNARMDVFARASDNTLWHMWWDHGQGWGVGESLGNALTSEPFVLSRGPDHMELFARGGSSELSHQWWDHGAGWGGPESRLGKLASAPFALNRGSSRVEIFARASDNTLWHNWGDF